MIITRDGNFFYIQRPMYMNLVIYEDDITKRTYLGNLLVVKNNGKRVIHTEWMQISERTLMRYSE